MNSYIGIDLGTSAVKLLLVSAAGEILSSRAECYPVSYPQSGWSEQAPADWLAAVGRGIPRLLEGQNADMVRGISFGGQMHGLVALDKDDNVIRPCILWNDGRTEAETAFLNEEIGRSVLSGRTGNIAFAGFTAPKLLWMRKHEPEAFARIAKIMLPKDYLTYLLTGVHATDHSDASGTLLYDVRRGCWSREMADLCGISMHVLPRLYASYEPVGTLKQEFARLWGLKGSIVVAAGAGDNAAAAVGTGTVKNGDCNVSLGTSGTVFVAEDAFSVDPDNALHAFRHANGKFHRMGCILSAASCNAWWMNILRSSDFAGEQAGAEALLGNNRVYFLPYLTGERSPHNDVNARGAFLGLEPTTTRTEMTLSVLEGVAFALKDCIRIAGGTISSTRVCGGGAKSALWRSILANVFAIPVERPAVEEGPAYGAAMLAMVACGEYASVEAVANALVRTEDVTMPETEVSDRYEKRYEVFRSLYPALRPVFPLLHQ